MSKLRSLLIIIPYENLYPPQNGGMLRCFHLLHQLALYFDVTALIKQDAATITPAFYNYPALHNVKFITSRISGTKNSILSVIPDRFRKGIEYRLKKRTLIGPADGDFLQMYDELVRTLRGDKFDIIVLENLSCLKFVSVIKRYDRTARIIYDAHNVDSNLFAEMHGLSSSNAVEWRSIIKYETSLHHLTDLVLTCSTHDLSQFMKLNHERLNAVVIPNGVELFEFKEDIHISDRKGYNILFCGSLDYEPNVEGLKWFLDSCWSILMEKSLDLKLTIVGSGSSINFRNYLEGFKNVYFKGKVPDVKGYYYNADIAIVPLKKGSGTRLKILEAMSLGVPVVSTVKGAEGIQIDEVNCNILIANDAKDFISKVETLLIDKDLRLRIRRNARKTVESIYDWRVIGGQLASCLDSL